MQKNILSTYSLLMKQNGWGPLLIGTGTFCIFALRFDLLNSGTLAGYAALVLAMLLVLAGIYMMFYQLRRDAVRSDSTTLGDADAKPEHVVFQLSKNYELLRRQTTQGFILAGVFMSLGLLVILSGSAGQVFGLTAQGSNLTTIAGLIMEFISGTSLLIYRLNFKRLNETSDRLDATWRVLTAHQLAASLPDEKKAEATIKLIDALVSRPVSK
jgi:hypothetical protein